MFLRFPPSCVNYLQNKTLKDFSRLRSSVPRREEMQPMSPISAVGLLFSDLTSEFPDKKSNHTNQRHRLHLHSS